MLVKTGAAEKYLEQIASSKENTWLLVASQPRKKEILKLWEDFIKDNSNYGFHNLQSLNISTINEYVIHFNNHSPKTLLNPVEQEFIFQLIIEKTSYCPRKWKDIPSLSSLFRKAYSVREFMGMTLENGKYEEIYQKIRTSYLASLDEFGFTDSENVLNSFFDTYSIPKNTKLYVEFFPAGTQRINWLMDQLDNAGATFMIPDTFNEIIPEKEEPFSEWINRLNKWVLDQKFDFNGKYFLYANDLEEISSQLDYLGTNPNCRLIMADPGKYRELFEDLSPSRQLKPANSRKSLKETSLYNLLLSIVNISAGQTDTNNLSSLILSGFHPQNFNDIELRICLKIFIELPKRLHSITLKSVRDELAKNNFTGSIMKIFDAHETQMLNDVWKNIETMIADILSTADKGLNPSNKIYKIAETISHYTGRNEDGSKEKLAGTFKESLYKLADFYRITGIKNIDKSSLQRDFNLWFSSIYFDFNPLIDEFDLFAFEEAKNLSANDPVWVSGLSIDVFPGAFESYNFLIDSKLHMLNDQLREIEQKSVFIQLVKLDEARVNFSCSRVVQGQAKEPSLVFQKKNEKSRIADLNFPFKYQSNLLEVIPPSAVTSGISKFSASSLNMYLNCPHKYFWKYVIGVKAEEKISDDLESPELGIIIHRVLQLFFSDDTVINGLKIMTDFEKTARIFGPILQSKINHVRDLPIGKKIFDDAINTQILTLWSKGLDGKTPEQGFLYRFLRSHLEYLISKKESLLESSGIDELFTELFIDITIDGSIFTGFLDRVDVYGSERHISIWDYKTGNTDSLKREEGKLINIQREFYSFLYRNHNSLIDAKIEVLFQPFTHKSSSPIGDYLAILKKAVDDNFKINKNPRNHLLTLNELWHRIESPEKIIESRLTNLPLELADSLVDFEGNVEGINEISLRELKDKLNALLSNYNTTSDRFILWLAERTKSGPYPGFVGRNCNYCEYQTMCEFYMINKAETLEENGND